MSQRQAPYRTTAAFPEPNYTQTPNDFFAMLPDMESSEVRVTLVMIRETFGYHRESFTMGIGKLADAAGLSRGAAKDGAEAAEKRGTFRRSNPTEQTEAEWELVVGQPLTPSTECIGDGQPLTVTPPLVDPQVRVKERKKEKKGDLIDGLMFYGKQAQDQKADKVEELIQEMERGLRVNISRSTANQATAKRILNDGRPFGQWLTWCISDEWRAAHLYIYADLEKVWRDYPQAFENQIGMNPQGLSIS
jgi:hypothetical protein